MRCSNFSSVCKTEYTWHAHYGILNCFISHQPQNNAIVVCKNEAGDIFIFDICFKDVSFPEIIVNDNKNNNDYKNPIKSWWLLKRFILKHHYSRMTGSGSARNNNLLQNNCKLSTHTKLLRIQEPKMFTCCVLDFR